MTTQDYAITSLKRIIDTDADLRLYVKKNYTDISNVTQFLFYKEFVAKIEDLDSDFAKPVSTLYNPHVLYKIMAVCPIVTYQLTLDVPTGIIRMQLQQVGRDELDSVYVDVLPNSQLREYFEKCLKRMLLIEKQISESPMGMDEFIMEYQLRNKIWMLNLRQTKTKKIYCKIMKKNTQSDGQSILRN